MERRMRIYVGNLSYEATDGDLEAAFAAYGQVSSAQVVTDRETGRSRGFGFVEMPNSNEATAAITGMNGKDLKGRAVNVNEARPRTDGGGQRGGGMGGGGGRGGMGGSRGGGGGGRW